MKRARRGTTSILALFAVAVSADDNWWTSPFNTNPAPSPVANSYDSPTEIYPERKETSSPTEIYPETTDTYSAAAEEEMFEDYEDPTPAPVEIERKETSSPTEIYVETTDGGEMYYMPVGDGDAAEDEEEEEEPTPMEKPGGASCSTYDEDVNAASLLDETCEWNTYMCCWTGHDGQGNFYSNTDVCRVLDYPEEGDVLEMPRDDEGPVYCHGFAWADGADLDTHILPLYHYVINVNSTEDGGYYGNVEGAPQCGCIEDMPVVSNAACSKYGGEGIEPCWDNSLQVQYKYKLEEEPNGEMDWNLIRNCDNEDVPDYDYRTCNHNTYMCCWTENSNGEMADNTDVCRVVDYPEIGETTEYPGDSEGEVHCHGFVWPEDASDKYIHLLAQFVQHYDHRDNRGYYGNIEGAPMCGCVEDMPIVSEADCTEYSDELDWTGRNYRFTSCKDTAGVGKDNDLRTAYENEYPTGDLPNLVEECDNKDN